MGRLSRRPWPLVIRTLVVVGLLVAGVRLACLRGVLQPIHVVSGSMGDALPGRHYRHQCRECGFTFRSDAGTSPAETWVCPNCGYRGIHGGDTDLQTGRRVFVDHWPRLWRRPRRWELWAFEQPGEDEQSQWSVKRVVGLPHERLSIRDGDLYVNERLLRKSLDEQRAVAVLVHDDRFRPPRTSDTPPRWLPDGSASGWHEQPAGYVYNLPGERSERVTDDESDSKGRLPLDWLTYRHWRCFMHPAPRSEEFPVLDQYAYNQSVSRELYDVPDLLMACQFVWEDKMDELGLRITDGREWFEVRLDWRSEEVRLYRDSGLCFQERFVGEQQGRLELACCDRQILLAVNGEVVLRYAYRRSAAPLQPTSRPVAIGTRQAGLRVGGLQIFRDLYYLDPQGTSRPWRVASRLQRGEYFVLGDNVPISDDSRHATGNVKDQRLLGIVVAPEVWAN